MQLTTNRIKQAISAALEERREHLDSLTSLRSIGVVVRTERSGDIIVSFREDTEYRGEV